MVVNNYRNHDAWFDSVYKEQKFKTMILDQWWNHFNLLRLQGDDAVALLRGVPQGTDDPSIVYLSSLFLGQIMEMNGRREDAIAAYRQAASWRPYSSVALPLAALLFVTGERDEAVAWTNRSLVIDRPEDDPFVQFGYGDLRRWPMYLAELRASFTERTP
jgi:tetratricopeptide (TPR) repeat protein